MSCHFPEIKGVVFFTFSVGYYLHELTVNAVEY